MYATVNGVLCLHKVKIPEGRAAASANNKFRIKIREQIIWVTLFKLMINFIRLMINKYNKILQNINHKLNNTINYFI